MVSRPLSVPHLLLSCLNCRDNLPLVPLGIPFGLLGLQAVIGLWTGGWLQETVTGHGLQRAGLPGGRPAPDGARRRACLEESADGRGMPCRRFSGTVDSGQTIADPDLALGPQLKEAYVTPASA